MKRLELRGRVALLSEKRTCLFYAARELSKDGHSVYSRATAEKEMELAALAYGLALKRYLGGRTE